MAFALLLLFLDTDKCQAEAFFSECTLLCCVFSSTPQAVVQCGFPALEMMTKCQEMATLMDGTRPTPEQ